MKSTTSTTTGYLSSLQSLGDGVLASVQARLELFAIEFHEEKFRLIQTCLWISALFFVAMMAVTFGSLTLVYLFWDSARLAVLGGLTLFYCGMLAVMIVAIRGFLARQPRPFAATLQELELDRACIRNEN